MEVGVRPSSSLLCWGLAWCTSWSGIPILRVGTKRLLSINDSITAAPKPPSIVPEKSSNISFNDNDNVLDMGTNKESVISAPKDIERLDKISKENDAKRKAEEAEYGDDDGPLKIGGEDLKLNISDVHDLNHANIKPPPSLDVEVLS